MRSLPLRLSSLLFPLALAGLSASCSLLNAPDDVVEGSGGSGPTTTTTTGMGGMAPACTVPADCASLTTDCAVGNCVQGSCVAEPVAVDTACGQTAQGSCDLADTCDGMGNCTNNVVANGTFCGDCPAGAGNCGLCNDGACPDCPGRATEKSFRSPLALSGWALTGDWRIYEEAPPKVAFFGSKPEQQCNDTFDNDGDTLIDFPNDPQCTSLTDFFEGTPQCGDGFDNDNDGLSDLMDPDCANTTGELEAGPTRFARPVLGTNGNRTNSYFIGTEKETSSATTPPTLIPATLDFLSWHIDEGDAFDLKAVQVSLDGQSFTSVAICQMGGGSPYPFCPFLQNRAADAWDVVSLPVPAQFVGQVGYVRFLYDTTDGCCDFERGWYIDALNFAQDCACSAAAECDFLTSGCADGSCDASTNECVPAAVNVGSACNYPGATTSCALATCNDNGLCDPDRVNFDAKSCQDCPDGPGLCTFCSEATCQSCEPTQEFYNFGFNPQWIQTGDWGFNSCLPPNQVTPTQSLCGVFPPGPEVPMAPSWLYNNGSRTTANPWTFSANEIEAGLFQLGPAVLPDQLTFNSWHQDRGGNNTFTPRDTKVIRASTDGVNWTTILNCDGNTTVPFCLPWTMTNVNRTLAEWDAITLDIPANLRGQVGFIEVTYNTVDQGQGWERGWIIDDINFARCD